mmetsp:Transcript_2356/g.3561  ORF Transcript_2356/g.3561 Transcript_2356/m.3561 type:complete len:202 (+) Transcript_2356:408-1013(+)|eukprot:CAMPEP_0197235962 /NCGR_PEP_ID=MMETSP1429-20130617/3265_1 /TAXON_ID=49237 /ORGANISM="Chaetoceros  sp., Strain UNC1202" /LENGTH=201 /DNA_ID=CAMNT_0042694689 /DNA_START=408 /DNA_END=1013 /DNA_ORIENTATION=-
MSDQDENEDVRERKRTERLEQNRISARESRKRKKTMIEELQRTVIGLSRDNKELNERNEGLRRQLMDLGAKHPNIVPLHAIMGGGGGTMDQNGNTTQAPQNRKPVMSQHQQSPAVLQQQHEQPPQQQSQPPQQMHQGQPQSQVQHQQLQTPMMSQQNHQQQNTSNRQQLPQQQPELFYNNATPVPSNGGNAPTPAAPPSQQ